MVEEIVIEHLTRVEGHGAIRVLIDGSKVKDVKLELFEGPRFIEKILVGKMYYEAPDIVARICSICPEPHQIATVEAIEKAFRASVGRQIKLLRELQLLADVISSHALHLYFLALPDYLGYPDVFSMTSKYGQEIRVGLQLKKTGNAIKETVSGRSIHGCTVKPGGYTRIPSVEELEWLSKLLKQSIEGALMTVKLFSSFDYPDFARDENVFMAVDPGSAYGFSGDHILISTGEKYPVEEYKLLTNEVALPYSTAKRSTYRGKSFMVGALARIALNGSKLRGQAAEMLKDVESKLDLMNPLTNNLAQAIELVYAIGRAIDIIDELLDEGLKQDTEVRLKPVKGLGASCVEAPRGTLYHCYELDDDGRVVKADIVTPTAQNAANIEKYIKISVERLLPRAYRELERFLELIARAYDPCISCATHLIKVERIH
ncbi:MAG: Ni/Fe hydrogenase subunit alpha [Candidatus Nezhaarchaeales archaeon]